MPTPSVPTSQSNGGFIGSSLPLPIMMLGAETLCETAARLLFMNVRWAKTVPAFVSLPFRDQLSLLEESWREFFVLGAAQFNLPLEMGPKLLGNSNNEEILNEIKSCQDAIEKFREMNVDHTEFACLKAIILFKTDKKDCKEQKAIVGLQDQAQLTLSKYINAAYPSQPMRFGKLLLLLPTLKCISAETIENLFFRRTIGTIPIEKIICDMYKSAM